MATTTPRFGLRKPASADLVNVTTDISDNMDKLDLLPGGTLGYAQVIASQVGITAAVDLTGLTVTVTVGAGRRIRITGFGLIYGSVVDAIPGVQIFEGATALTIVGRHIVTTANTTTTFTGSVVLTPSTGVHTYKLVMSNAGGGNVSLDASSTYPAFILVEDIGV